MSTEPEGNISKGNDIGGNGKEEEKLSPLAMAAADWLEDEEDELEMYWNRFDDAKSSSAGINNESQDAKGSIQSKQTSIKSDETTEDRLDRYYESRGIDKREEKKYAPLILKAVESAKKAPSAEEALKELEPIRKYLQYNTKIGENAYFEVAQALDASGEEAEATVIYEQLAASFHADIRKKSRELLAKLPRPKRVYKKNVWKFFWNDWD